MESNSLSHGNIGSNSVPIPIDLRVVCSIVGALALFAPFLVAINLHWGDVTLMAMTWTYYVPYGFAEFGYIQFMATIPWTIWRVVFVYQMVRYYQGRSTRRVTVLLGILAEIPILVLWELLPLLFPSATFGAFLTIPTPLMLLGASVFMWMTPFPVPKTPFDVQAEPDRWWQRKVDSPVGQPIESRRWDGLIHGESRLKCPRCGSEEIGREMHPGSFGIRARFVYSCKKCKAQWER